MTSNNPPAPAWQHQGEDFNAIAIDLAEHYWESRKHQADATYSQCLEDAGNDLLDLVRARLQAEVDDAYDRGIEEAAQHMYTASQVRQAITQVFKTKTDPKMVAVILEDLQDELSRLTQPPQEQLTVDQITPRKVEDCDGNHRPCHCAGRRECHDCGLPMPEPPQERSKV